MRTSRAFSALALVALLGLSGPARALDATVPAADTPAEAFRHGFDAYRQGDKIAAIEALSSAASRGHPIAQWKLGRMYAEGDGTEKDALKAFQLFSEVANAYADESPTAASAPFVASAFVALGSYYRDGIPGSRVTADSYRARQIFSYAASYFGDPEAQFALARMYYRGEGGDRDPRQAARWAKLAAEKGNTAGQALLGHLLFEGDGVERQPVLGLMFLTVARERAGAADRWVRQLHEEAFSLATETERRTALALADDWQRRHASTAER